MSKVIVIGSGFSSLTASACLAAKGYEVVVLEKNDGLGGRARQFKAQGFTFDMGPSWYWMPDVFESYFQRFGKTTSDFYDLRRLDPSYQVFYPNQDRYDIPANLNELFALFEKLEKGSAKQLQKFLDEAAYKYDVGINDLVYKPGLSITELLDFRVAKGVFKLHIFQSISDYIRKHFSHPYLIQLLEFPILFLGAKPQDTPALYSLMNYADIKLGTWYPMGGMHKIVEAMVQIAEEQGVTFRTNQEVQKIVVENGKAKQVITNQGIFDCDIVVGGADYQHIDSILLEPEYQNYTEKYWSERKMAPSSLIYYIGINKKLPNLTHHSLFFDQDFDQHAEEIYTNPSWPKNPLFYVCCPSQTDPSVAPEGQENMFILIPTAPDLKDNEEIKQKYLDITLSRIEKHIGVEFKDNITYKRSYAYHDFVTDYHAFKGNAYGLANTISQTANLKPSIRNKKVSNLFYTGQLTVPGPGVPPSIISGQVVADHIFKNFSIKKSTNYQPI